MLAFEIFLVDNLGEILLDRHNLYDGKATPHWRMLSFSLTMIISNHAESDCKDMVKSIRNVLVYGLTSFRITYSTFLCKLYENKIYF